MTFNIGDARELTNWNSTCTIMKNAIKKYTGKDNSNVSYNKILKSHANDLIKDERNMRTKELYNFINNIKN